MIDFRSFSDEMQKIAEENRKMNREKLKQLFKNTALVAGGTGVGIGLAEGARTLVKRYGTKAPIRFRQVAAAGVPLLGGGAVLGLKNELEKEKKRSLEDAYQRGVRAGQRDI